MLIKNPKTGRLILVNGPTYNKLKAKGLALDNRKKYPLINIKCSDIPDIRREKILGEGAEGVVYRYCIEGKCDYAVKINKRCDNYSELESSVKMTNIASDHGLAPRIYEVIECDDV